MIGQARLVWQNMRLRPGRSLILVNCIATLTALLVAATLIDHASQAGISLGIERLGADLVAVPRDIDQQVLRAYLSGNDVEFYMPNAIENNVGECPFVAQTSSQLYLRSLTNAACCSVWSVFLIGFDPQTDFLVRPWLSKHRDKNLGPNDILVGAAIQAEPGMTMKFYGHPFKVAGTLDAGGMGLDTAVFLPIHTARKMIADSVVKAAASPGIASDQISAVFIRLKPNDQGGLPAWKAAYELERLIPEISIIRPADITVKARENLAVGLRALYTVSFSVWPMTALLVGLIFTMAAHERQQEIGLLRAMGATRGVIFRMILFEALIISIAGAAIGLGLSFGLVAVFARMIALRLEIPFAFPSLCELMRIFVEALLLAIATGSVSALIPACKISAQEPYEAIRRP